MESEAQRQQRQAEAAERKEQKKLAQQKAAIQRQAEAAVAWPGARIKFNRANGALSVEKDGKTAIALAPKGKELLDTLLPDIRKKVEGNQFVKVTAFVAESILVRIEVG
jgi:CRISPR-associated protein Cmr6